MEVSSENTRIKCYQCMRPSITCVCKYINPVQTQTRFIILMHPKEYKKEKNGTGHMTKLQLENSEIIVGVDFTHNKRVNEILNDEYSESFLLYPGTDSFNLSVRKKPESHTFLGTKPYLFILDGTWPCARKMLKLSKNLQKLQRVSFDNTITSKFLIKQQPEPLCLSTIESVYTVLNLMNEAGYENCNTKDFLVPFEKMIASQIDYMLNPNNQENGSTIKRELLPKTNYKKSPLKSVVFEVCD